MSEPLRIGFLGAGKMATALAQGWIREGDVWGGGKPTNIALPGLEGSLKAGITQLVTRAGLTIIQSGFNATTITRQNTNLKNLLNGMRDAVTVDQFVLTTGTEDNYCVFVLEGALFWLKVQVGKTV